MFTRLERRGVPLPFRSRVYSALAHSGAEVLARQGIQFAAMVVIARYVTPAEFGVVASLSLFAGLAALLVDSGLHAALIQTRVAEPKAESSVFWFSLCAATLVALLLGLSGPTLALLFAQPVLAPVAWAMALNLWIVSWAVVPSALLTRQLDFAAHLRISLIASIAGAVAGISLAMSGSGVWALVGQVVLTSLVTSAAIWCQSEWRPRLNFSWSSLRHLWRFGGYMFASAFLDTVASRLHTVLIGRLYTASDLGLYARAVGTRDFPQSIFITMMGRVSFPAFAEMATDKAQLRRSLRRAIITSGAISGPVMLGMAAIAEPLVAAMYGPNWSPAAPYLQILCLSGALAPLHVANTTLMMGLGFGRALLVIELAKKSVLLVLVIAASQHSVIAMAWATVVASSLAIVFNARCAGRELRYGMWAQLRDVAPYLALSILMAVLVRLLGHALAAWPDQARLIAEIGCGALIYIGAGVLLRLEAFQDIQRLWFERPDVVTP